MLRVIVQWVVQLLHVTTTSCFIERLRELAQVHTGAHLCFNACYFEHNNVRKRFMAPLKFVRAQYVTPRQCSRAVHHDMARTMQWKVQNGCAFEMKIYSETIISPSDNTSQLNDTGLRVMLNIAPWPPSVLALFLLTQCEGLSHPICWKKFDCIPLTQWQR